MPRPVSARLDDISVRIAHIESLLADRTIDDVRKDQFAVAALERFLEVISEASRHLPDDMKDTCPEIPWRRIADLGNLIRHAYQHIDIELLWAICTDDIGPLKDAVAALTTPIDDV